MKIFQLSYPLLMALFLFQMPAFGVAGPNVPTDITATSPSPSSLVVTWENGGGGTRGFYIGGEKGSTAPSCESHKLVGAVFTRTYTGLTADTEYTFSVCAYNSSGELSKAAIVHGVTMMNSIPPDPTGLVATGLSPTEVGLTWTSGGGSTTGFLVNAVIVNDQFNGNVPCGKTNVGTVTAYTIKNLKPDNIYYVSVCAYNSSGVLSDYPDITSVITVPAVLPPDPTNLIANGASSTTIELSWESGGGSTTGFFVNAVPVNAQFNGNVPCGKTNVDAVTAYTIKNLQPNMIYYVIVCAYDVYGNTSDGAIASTLTLPTSSQK